MFIYGGKQIDEKEAREMNEQVNERAYLQEMNEAETRALVELLQKVGVFSPLTRGKK